MGKALQIRVSAVTWNEDLLEQLWPQLTELAFSVPIKHEKRGVLEMVRALDEGLTFMKWSKARQDALGPGIREAARLKQELDDSEETLVAMRDDLQAFYESYKTWDQQTAGSIAGKET